ncbi:hypothetical protein [Streptomyces sp. NPDC005262]|uniref:hypothetical protein n=1 Tax=Streptomyces sp. NPDC005262 TaxID=3364710 RepID=UPI0036815AA9
MPVYSSDRGRHRLHRGGNRRLNSVLYTASIVQKLTQHQLAAWHRGVKRIELPLMPVYSPKLDPNEVLNADLKHLRPRRSRRRSTTSPARHDGSYGAHNANPHHLRLLRRPARPLPNPVIRRFASQPCRAGLPIPPVGRLP